MKRELMEALVCTICNSCDLFIQNVQKKEEREIKEGNLCCSNCKSLYRVENYLPRFVPAENYAHSFGFQWNKHAKTQLDTYSGVNMSQDRFYQVTKWNKNLKGQRILEAGSGAGRFTQVVLKTGAKVYSFDYSNAVEANLENNGEKRNLFLFQGDIYHIPLQRSFFDKIFCFGVLQHCPDPKKAFMNLINFLKPGGEIAIDIYELAFRSFVNPKYWLRPFTKRLKPETLYNLVIRLVPCLFPIKMRITEHIPLGKYYAFFIPVAYHKGFIPQVDNMTYPQLLKWSILDTFDKFAPKYDKPQTISTVKRWFEEADLSDVTVCYGPNGIIGKGIRRM